MNLNGVLCVLPALSTINHSCDSSFRCQLCCVCFVETTLTDWPKYVQELIFEFMHDEAGRTTNRLFMVDLLGGCVNRNHATYCMALQQ
jgi:mannose/fructose-specific phosphotransferase system component IIA